LTVVGYSVRGDRDRRKVLAWWAAHRDEPWRFDAALAAGERQLAEHPRSGVSLGRRRYYLVLTAIPYLLSYRVHGRRGHERVEITGISDASRDFRPR
jgi:plasmid stabilization system protein ParE